MQNARQNHGPKESPLDQRQSPMEGEKRLSKLQSLKTLELQVLVAATFEKEMFQGQDDEFSG